MNEEMEQRIRDLAQPLWDSAARPYGLALEFWLMAEQMVLEAASAFNRWQAAGVPQAPGASLPGEKPAEMPVDRVRALAECMWEAAGRQYDVAQDYWLAAERHVQAMLRAATAPAPNPFAREAAQLPPWEYLQRIREAAYFGWLSAGQQYGDALDYWVRAEQQILEQLRRAAAPAPTAAADDAPAPAPTASTGPAADEGARDDVPATDPAGDAPVASGDAAPAATNEAPALPADEPVAATPVEAVVAAIAPTSAGETPHAPDTAQPVVADPAASDIAAPRVADPSAPDATAGAAPRAKAKRAPATPRATGPRPTTPRTRRPS